MKTIYWNDDLRVIVTVYEGDQDIEKLKRILIKNNFKHTRKRTSNISWTFTIPCNITTIGTVYKVIKSN